MKAVQFCMAFLLVGVVFLSLNCFKGMKMVDGSAMTGSRNPKEVIDDRRSCGGEVSLEDYPPYDSSPSSKASIRPGPIEHGAPLMPYIPNPKPSPPPRPSDDDGSP